jgi:sugar lactone lactonase YvrE
MTKHLFYFFPGLTSVLLCNSIFAAVPVISYSPSTNVYTVNTTITTLTPIVTDGVSAIGFNNAIALTGATLNNPRGVAIDASGNIYVTNSGNNTISKYNSSGTYVGTFGSGATMSSPKDVVFDSSGNAYVLNLGSTPGTGSVYKYNSSGVYQSTILSGLNYALGITIDASNNIYIADQGAVTVKKYNTSGALLLSLPTTNLSTPLGVAVDASGNIYVLNNGGPNVTKYNSAGTYLSTFLSGFTSPQSITIDGAGNFYIGDNSPTNTVYVYNASGTLLTSKAVNDPEGIAVDNKGNMFTSAYYANQMSEYKPSGGFFLSTTLPAGLSFNSSTGSISGTPTVAQTATIYTVTAYNASGSGSTTVSITVNPTAPTGTGGSACSSGSATLTASGSLPAGGIYNWYAALSGGSSLGTGATFVTPSITATTTYYVDYTADGTTSTPRTAVTATVSAGPVLSIVPATGLSFSYPFSGNANDASGNNNNGTLQNAPSITTDRYGAVSSAYSFNGTTQYISTATAIASPGPQNFSISAWFKTSSAGGKLVGFGSSQTGSSPNNDRHIYMSNSGQLYFALYPSAYKVLNTTASYADGKWHHVVATESTTNGANLYVDGALQATDATMTASQAYAGYWRVGYDNMVTWPNAPTNYYFNGSLDDITIYSTELTASQVNILYGAGGGTFCAGNSFSLTANTVTGATYAWTGPGGFSSSAQNPTVTNAVAGTYELVVTASGGCTSTINVTAPSNAITYTWTGAAGTTNPMTAGNWDQLPPFNSTSNIVIPTGLSFYPSLTADANLYGLTIANGASFNLNGHTLSVGCNIYNSSGGQILYGSSNSSGIIWNGSSATQTYSGGTTTNTAQLGTMTINNSANGTLTISGGPVDIYNLLTITKGNLTVGSSPAALTLKSTATQTASIAAIPSGSTITGTVNVERYITGGSGFRSYRLLSSPVYTSTISGNNIYSINYLLNSTPLTGTDGTAGGFSKSGNPTLYLYRENMTPAYTTFTNSNYRGIKNISASPNYTIDTDGGPFNIPVGNGFLFFFRGDKTTSNPYSTGTIPLASTLTASGTLNQGTILVKDWFTPSVATLSYTSSSPAGIIGYNLVGNPYPSNIDWDQFSNSVSTSPIYGPNVSKTIAMLNPNGSYATYQAGSGGVGATNGATHIIPSGAGFFVLASNASASLTFTEAAKTTAQVTGNNLFMGMPADYAINNQYLRLQMVLDTFYNEDIVIRFNKGAGATFNFDDDGLYKTGFGKVSLFSLTSDHVPLAINVQPLPKSNETIGLGVSATVDGVYQLKVKELVGIPQLFEVWLMDSYKNDSLDLRHNTTYTFNISKADTNSYGNNRFRLVIRQNPALAVHLLNFSASKSANGAQIEWKAENEENYTRFTLERSTDNGGTFKILTGFTSNTQGAYGFLDKDPLIGTGQYRLRLEDLNGTISYSKVVALMYSDLNNNIASNIVIYPNPAKNTINLSVTQNSDAASNVSYSITILSSSGQVVKKTISSQAQWQENISELQPGTYVVQIINGNDKSWIGKSKFVKL